MYYAIQARSWGKSQQNGHLVGCLQQKSCMGWSRKLGEHCRHICTIQVHVHVVNFSESVQHALKANCS